MTRLLALVLPLALLAGGCAEDEDYCDRVKDEAPGLQRTVDANGTSGLLETLPTLERLAEDAPDDIADEWEVFLGALHELRDVLDDTGVDPEQVEGELPAGLTKEERERVEVAAAQLLSPRVVSAADAVEQQALDVCGTPLF